MSAYYSPVLPKLLAKVRPLPWFGSRGKGLFINIRVGFG